MGGDAAVLYAAVLIAQAREWPRRARHQQARLDDDLPPDSRTARYLARRQNLRLEHLRAGLTMLGRVAPAHALVALLGDELRAL